MLNCVTISSCFTPEPLRLLLAIIVKHRLLFWRKRPRRVWVWTKLTAGLRGIILKWSAAAVCWRMCLSYRQVNPVNHNCWCLFLALLTVRPQSSSRAGLQPQSTCLNRWRHNTLGKVAFSFSVLVRTKDCTSSCNAHSLENSVGTTLCFTFICLLSWFYMTVTEPKFLEGLVWKCYNLWEMSILNAT